MTTVIKNWANNYPHPSVLTIDDGNVPFDVIASDKNGDVVITISRIDCSDRIPDKSAYISIIAAIDEINPRSIHNYVALVFPSQSVAQLVASSLPFETLYEGKEIEIMVGYVDDNQTFQDIEHRLYYV